MKIHSIDTLNDLRETGLRKLVSDRPVIGVGMGTCGIGNGAEILFEEIKAALADEGIDAFIRPVGCFGYCSAEPLVNIRLPGQPLVILKKVIPREAKLIAQSIAKGEVPRRKALCKIEQWDHITGNVVYGKGYPEVPTWDQVPFYAGQMKLVLRNCGLINPEDLEEYAAVGGYQGLFRALDMAGPEAVVAEVKKAKLRGRGGAGYPAGVKWDLLRQAPGDTKYLVCNADEGDPGAYMNRNEIESDPHMLIEGMLIGAYGTGASDGVVYLRCEYPLAVQRLQKAIDQARDAGLLGKNILGTDFSFDLQLVEGAGAFVCGEETAMIASLEGMAGRPRPRPPFPAESGLWQKPTNINNVETWCNVPAILSRGAEWYAATGTPESTGTKVFSLVGKVANTGLVEMPLGTPLRHMVYTCGGGSSTGRKVKAVQTGGPSGGCIPADEFDTPVDYESLRRLGAIMGSGGVVVMDEETCMVDVARYFIEFSHDESCGKCVPCRAGVDQCLRILTRFTDGEGSYEDLAKLRELGEMIRETSLCGLGQTAPNPVLTTLKYFLHEYEKHVVEKRCPGGVCEKLYMSPCENGCPLHMRVPAYLRLLKEGREDEAAELVWHDNPLPASTGRVCVAPCEERCRRGGVDKAINMKETHRYLADAYLADDKIGIIKERLAKSRLPDTGHKVAILGAGPAGLSAAFYLAMLGHEAVVFEGKPEAGGTLRYSIPQHRLPKNTVQREIDVLEAAGVQFRCNTRIGEDIEIEEIEREFAATFVSTGARMANSLNVPGEDNENVWRAIRFLEEIAWDQTPDVGEHVVVIGGGNGAIDAARSAIRIAPKVTLVYTQDPLDLSEPMADLHEAKSEGVEVLPYATPERFFTDGKGRVSGVEFGRMEAGEVDRTGTPQAVPTGERFAINCSAVILAVGVRPDDELVRRECVTIRRGGLIDADWNTQKTARGHIYAGGDAVNGATDVVSAMAEGKQAARSIDRLLTGDDHLESTLGSYTYDMSKPEEIKRARRTASKRLDVDKRSGNFDEVLLGITAEGAAAEAERCLRCDVKDECAHA